MCASVKRVAILGHADADGHLIAEQVRRNLSHIPAFDISLVVDPMRTKDHRTWLNLDSFSDLLNSCQLVFFVDMMFAPSSFVEEAAALVKFANDRPATRFFLIDHHPLPLRRLAQAANLRALYRQDVLDCRLGRSSGMMLLAALLESQPTRARAMKQPIHDVLARGVRRAAAPGGPLPGEKLMALLRFDRWSELAELGRDDAAFHRLHRGFRAKGSPISTTLERLDRLATELLHSSSPSPADQHNPASDSMSYDFETASYASNSAPVAALAEDARRNPKDLEAIMLLLELAAINLTSGPDSEFTIDELLAEARDLGADELQLEETDVKIVLGKAGFLRKVGGRRLQMR